MVECSNSPAAGREIPSANVAYVSLRYQIKLEFGIWSSCSSHLRRRPRPHRFALPSDYARLSVVGRCSFAASLTHTVTGPSSMTRELRTIYWDFENDSPTGRLSSYQTCPSCRTTQPADAAIYSPQEGTTFPICRFPTCSAFASIICRPIALLIRW